MTARSVGIRGELDMKPIGLKSYQDIPDSACRGVADRGSLFGWVECPHCHREIDEDEIDEHVEGCAVEREKGANQ